MDTAHGVFGEDSNRDSGNRIGFSDSYEKGLHWSMAKGVDIVANLIVRVLYLLCIPLCMMVVWFLFFGIFFYYYAGVRSPGTGRFLSLLDGAFADGDYLPSIHWAALLVSIGTGVLGFFFGPWLARTLTGRGRFIDQPTLIREVKVEEMEFEDPNQLKLDV